MTNSKTRAFRQSSGPERDTGGRLIHSSGSLCNRSGVRTTNQCTQISTCIFGLSKTLSTRPALAANMSGRCQIKDSRLNLLDSILTAHSQLEECLAKHFLAYLGMAQYRWLGLCCQQRPLSGQVPKNYFSTGINCPRTLYHPKASSLSF